MSDNCKTQILFVCTGNTCRSPMAQYIFAARPDSAGSTAVSAGLYAFDGEAMSEFSQAVLEENGISSAGFFSQSVTYDLVEESSVILCMASSHRRELLRRYPQAEAKCFTLLPQGDIPDPFGQSVEVYRETFAAICRGIDIWIKFLTEIKQGVNSPEKKGNADERDD